MLFMAIERYKNPTAVYDRLHERGRMLPPGLEYIGSWVDADLSRCFQLMETHDIRLLKEWAAKWDDIVEIEVVRVLSSEQVQTSMGRIRRRDEAIMNKPGIDQDRETKSIIFIDGMEDNDAPDGR
jgi:hypothetical protein